MTRTISMPLTMTWTIPITLQVSVPLLKIAPHSLLLPQAPPQKATQSLPPTTPQPHRPQPKSQPVAAQASNPPQTA